MPPCLTLSNKGWIGGKALRHTDVMSRGCTCTLSRLTSLETGDRLLPYGSGTLHLPGLEIERPETRLKDYLLTYLLTLLPYLLTLPLSSQLQQTECSMFIYHNNFSIPLPLLNSNTPFGVMWAFLWRNVSLLNSTWVSKWFHSTHLDLSSCLQVYLYEVCGEIKTLKPWTLKNVYQNS